MVDESYAEELWAGNTVRLTPSQREQIRELPSRCRFFRCRLLFYRESDLGTTTRHQVRGIHGPGNRGLDMEIQG